MTTKLVKWASNDGQIIEPGLSDGCRTKLLTSVVGLSTIAPGLGVIWEMSVKTRD